MLRVIYYRSKCIGCGSCAQVDRNRWRLSRKDGKSTLVNGRKVKNIFHAEAGDDEYDSLEQAAVHCPVRIIRVE